MYSSWMPQNIQKRLLLYLLQQLSLFSAIELPNLEEVSLNNIHLRDVSIDPERLGELPGFRLRQGRLRDVELKGGMVDGVNVNVTGLDLELVPFVGLLHLDSQNSTFLLAQSTADLARTVVFADELQIRKDAKDVADLQNKKSKIALDDTSTSTSTPVPASNKKPSPLGGVMSKAVEIALLRLHICIEDINVKIFFESVTLSLQIEKITFDTMSGVRNLNIYGIKLLVLSSTISAGNTSKSSTSAEMSSHDEKLVSKLSNEKNSIDKDSDNEDSENGEDYLSSSMVFTHEEAVLIYMSATSQSFVPKSVPVKPLSEDNVVLMHIDRAEISFEGAVLPTDIKVHVNSINIATVPLVPASIIVIDTVAKLLRIRSHELMKQRSFQKDPLLKPSQDEAPSDGDPKLEDDDLDDDFEKPLLINRVRVSELAISLTSALNNDGTFSSYEDDLSVIFTNCNVKQKIDGLIYGGIEKFECVRYLNQEPETIFRFANEDNSKEADEQGTSPGPRRADFRFEFQKKSSSSQVLGSEVTILLSKLGKLNLDVGSLSKLLPFLSSTARLFASTSILSDLFSKLKSNPPKQTQKKLHANFNRYQITVQTASFEIIVLLMNEVKLLVTSFPISFDSSRSELNIHKVVLSTILANRTKQLLIIPLVVFSMNNTETKTYIFTSAGQNPQNLLISCPKSLLLGSISGSIESHTLFLILESVSASIRKVNEGIHKAHYKIPLAAEQMIHISSRSTFAGNYSNSMHFNPTQNRRINGPLKSMIIFGDQKFSVASFRLRIDLISFVLHDLFPNFGDLKSRINLIEVFAQQEGIHGCLGSLSVDRLHKSISESFISRISGVPKQPMALFKYKSDESKPSLDLEVRYFCIEYYTKWLKLFEKDVSLGHDAENIADATSKPTKSSEYTDLRLSLSHFAFGLVPLQLPSKIYLGVKKGTVDFTSNKMQCYAKSSFRDLLLYLSDDALQLPETPRKEFDSVHQAILSKGFIEIGRANNAHVGITITTDIEEMKRRQLLLGLSGHLPLVDVKLNSDEQELALCADSAHTLLQTLNNLKEVVVLKDEEKSRVKVNEDDLPTIQSQLEELLNGLHDSTEQNKTKIPNMPPRPGERLVCDDFLIVDEYYDDSHLMMDEQVEDFTQLNLDDSGKNLDNLLKIVEGHFTEKPRHRNSSIVPFKLNINLSKAQVYLHDGYDWKTTRKSFRKAVKSLEKRSEDTPVKRKQRGINNEIVNENDLSSNLIADAEPIEEVLYQSIHITTNRSDNAGVLINSINSELQSENSNEESSNYKDLKLSRSARHKVLARIFGVEFNVTNYTSRDPRSAVISDMTSETVNKLDVRVDTVTVFDNVQSSTWNKLLTYMSSLGEREVGTNMFQLEIKNIRPDPNLVYTEAIVSLKLLPLRFYIDQDTLNFIVRFFEFKDCRFNLPVDEIMYFQKLTLEPIRLKFDYKPKKMDLAGLRAGNHAEWANLFVLNGSNLSLEKAVIYGAHGFPDLGKRLGELYGPYIQKCQIAGILSGIGPVKSIVNVGKGLRDFVAIPLKEYLKDRRLLYGLQKGSKAFAKTTSYELLRLGVNLASGLQVALETLEEYFGGEGVEGRKTKAKSRRIKEKSTKIAEVTKKPNLMETSLNLRALAAAQGDNSSGQRKYSMTAIDEDDDSDEGVLQPSILILDPDSQLSLSDVFEDDQDDFDQSEASEAVATEEKLVSLYSNQPKNTKEGLKFAYKSLGKNLSSTKNRFIDIKKELQEAETIQDLLKTIAKSSPVLVLRPIIGTTEATMKALMGISNEIDSRSMREMRDKYRPDVIDDSVD